MHSTHGRKGLSVWARKWYQPHLIREDNDDVLGLSKMSASVIPGKRKGEPCYVLAIKGSGLCGRVFIPSSLVLLPVSSW